MNLAAVVLVHGAFADASGWGGVTRELLGAGVRVLAPANPLRGSVPDSEYLASVVGEIGGPVVLAGHSYGGVAITGAAARAGNVAGLVYVAAFALAEGETPVSVTGKFPETLMNQSLRPAHYPDPAGGQSVELYVQEDRYGELLAAGVPAEVTAVAAVSQRPVAAGVFGESLPAAPWRTLPSWYVVAAEDRSLHPDAQRFMAARAGAAVVESASPHLVMVHQPAVVAGHILSALRALASAEGGADGTPGRL